MGLFSRLGKKSNKKNTEIHEEENHSNLELLAGTRMEVTDISNGQLLFSAKFMYPRGDKAELHMISSDDVSNSENTNVLIRGYNDREAKAVWMEGNIRLNEDTSKWFVENLKLKNSGNDRSFFRLSTNIDAGINQVGKFDSDEMACKLLNISIGGACISSDKEFHPGDKLLLKVKLHDESEPMLMLCRILRITKKDENRFEYGCRFDALSDNDQDKITKSIFELQRKKLSKS